MKHRFFLMLGVAAALGVAGAVAIPATLAASCGDDNEWTPVAWNLQWTSDGLFVLLPPAAERLHWSEGSAWTTLPAATWTTGSYTQFVSGSLGRVLSLRPRDVVAAGCVANDIDLRLESRLGVEPRRLMRVPAGYVDGLQVSPSGRLAALEMSEWWLDDDVDGAHDFFMIVDLVERRVLGRVPGSSLGWGPDETVVVTDATEHTAQWIGFDGSGVRVLAARLAVSGSRLKIVRGATGAVLFVSRPSGPGAILRPVRAPSGPEWRSVPTRLWETPTTLHIEAGLALYVADPPSHAALRSVDTAHIVGRITGHGDILMASFQPSGAHLAVVSYSTNDTDEVEYHESQSDDPDEAARENAWPSSNAVDVFELPCTGEPPSHWGHDSGFVCRPTRHPGAVGRSGPR